MIPVSTPVARRLRAARLATATALALALGATTPLAQSDQVREIRADGEVRVRTGEVTVNELDRVVLIESNGRERTLEASEVAGVEFKDVPRSYEDARLYQTRGEWESAAEQYRTAADDSGTRDVVRASARLRAGAVLLRGGATNPRFFGEARSELERFISDYPSNRELPRAQALLARALHLSGEPAAAADAYASVFDKVTDGAAATGYDVVSCLEAGLRGGYARLDAGDAAGGELAFRNCATAAASALAALTEGASTQPALLALEQRARLGEGFCMIASGQEDSAATFFQREVDREDDLEPSARFVAHLGLAEALLARGESRRAQFEFAHVSALDFADADRRARALVGLARCDQAIGDTNSDDRVRRWLTAAVEEYGDTPAARTAQELLDSL